MELNNWDECSIDMASFEDEDTWDRKISTWVKVKTPVGQINNQGNRKIIWKVPERLRKLKKEDEDNYNPKVIARPYHHKKEKDLKFGRSFKYGILEKYVSGCSTTTNINGLYKKVFDMVTFLRGFYEHGSTDEYGDDEFAAMMLLDGCCILYFIESQSSKEGIEELRTEVGRHNFFNDMFLLENQLPFPVLQALMSFKHEKEKWEEIFNKSFSLMKSGSFKPLESKITFESFDEMMQVEESKHLHLLDIEYDFFRFLPQDKPKKWIAADSAYDFYPSHSAMELKAKGIHLSSNTSKSKLGSRIEFESHCLYGKIKVPPQLINLGSKKYFLNMLAYEYSPEDSSKELYVSAYISFIRSLMQNVEDVKELKSKGIILHYLASDEEVLNMFKEIDLSPASASIYWNLSLRIHRHIINKGKTWIAELNSTYFSSPWSLIAFLGSVVAIALTFVQTYYTIYPRK